MIVLLSVCAIILFIIRLVQILYLTKLYSDTPHEFWNNSHNFRDIELKFSIFLLAYPQY